MNLGFVEDLFRARKCRSRRTFFVDEGVSGFIKARNCFVDEAQVHNTLLECVLEVPKLEAKASATRCKASLRRLIEATTGARLRAVSWLFVAQSVCRGGPCARPYMMY